MRTRKHPWRVFVLALVLIVLGLIIAAVVLPLGGSNSASTGGKYQGAHARGGHKAPVPVDVAPVSRRDLPVYLSGLGTVQAYNVVTVRPQVSGQLVSIDFDEGGEVHKGQLLATIDPRTFQAALDEAKAKLAQDQAQLKSAQTDLSRFEKLAPQGYVSGQQLDQQKQTVAQRQAAVAADRAAIESARVQLSYTKITSPINGRVGMRLVDVGNIVTAGASSGIVVVTQVKPISIVFTLPEQELEQVLAADALGGGDSGDSGLQVQALDRSNSTVLATGTLTALDNQINTATGTIELKATFSNQQQRLWPGQFVNVRLLVQTLKQAPVVPIGAVQRGPNGAYVYVLEADATVQMQPIKVGVTQDGFSEITAGLEVGQVVVVNGQYHLQPGDTVKAHQLTPSAAASVAASAAPAAAGAAAALAP